MLAKFFNAPAFAQPAAPTIAILSAEPGQIHMRFSGEPQQDYRLEASSNLRTWVPWVAFNTASGKFDLVDPQDGSATRFYRAAAGKIVSGP